MDNDELLSRVHKTAVIRATNAAIEAIGRDVANNSVSVADAVLLLEDAVNNPAREQEAEMYYAEIVTDYYLSLRDCECRPVKTKNIRREYNG